MIICVSRGMTIHRKRSRECPAFSLLLSLILVYVRQKVIEYLLACQRGLFHYFYIYNKPSLCTFNCTSGLRWDTEKESKMSVWLYRIRLSSIYVCGDFSSDSLDPGQTTNNNLVYTDLMPRGCAGHLSTRWALSGPDLQPPPPPSRFQSNKHTLPILSPPGFFTSVFHLDISIHIPNGSLQSILLSILYWFIFILFFKIYLCFV